jgi:3-methylcrotonyl-CoA carboxylase alpha subunit
MESMKMELRIASKVTGVIASVNIGPGDTVQRNAVVAVVEPAAAAEGVR